MPVSVLPPPTVSNVPAENKCCFKETNSLYQKPYPFKSLVQCDLTKCTRGQIRDYFTNTYDLNELIFSALKDESYFVKCPDRLRLPLIFYLAHTASVYINKLMLAGLINERVNRNFEILFETGVDEMSWDDTENYRMGGSFKWPSVPEVLLYRQEVRKVVLDVIDSAPLQLPVNAEHPWWSVFMGMEHERIHLETSSVLIRQLPVDMVRRPDCWKYGPTAIDIPVGPNDFIRIPEGRVTVGKPLDFPSYGWDNEYGKVETDVPEFEATKYLITNKEFLEFVKEGGYERRGLWTDEGWKWVEFRQAHHPTFWVCDKGCKSGCGADLTSYSHCAKSHDQDEGCVNGNGKSHDRDDGYANENGKSHDQDEGCFNGNGKSHDQDEGCANGNGNSHDQDKGCSNGNGKSHDRDEDCTNGDGFQFKYRTIYDVIDMPWEWPVDVNCHEARAFCSWKGPGYRLPTEAEHHRMRGDKPLCCDVTCDPSFNSDYPANIGLKYGSSTPVNMFPPSPAGFHDVYGNVWEWTEDHFNGLPGFKTSYLYDDFSSPCFDGRHTMMAGGSWMSTGAESSRFARFAFRRHFFQHLGFRLARSNETTPARICKAEVFVLGSGVTDNPMITPCIQEDKCINSVNCQFQYESEKELDSKLNMEYGNIQNNGFPLCKLVKGAVEKYTNGSVESAVIFGSGTGATSFLLTKTFEKVVGVDYSGRFIDAAMKIQSGKQIPYGDGKIAALPTSVGVEPSKVVFKQMTWVPNEIEGFDVIIFEFMDRVSEPKGWLIKLWECLLPGGLVIIKTEEKWKDYPKKHIGKWFEFCESAFITDHQEVTVWQLKK